MIDKETLLEAYKAYDYLNADAEHPTIKIFVSYIKPSFLFKSEILMPIHLGRAVETSDSKDGTVSETDLQWLHQNCIGDDDVEGSISSLNRRIGFFTGTYWAWKNYERLGSPEYFGSFGYRKLLAPSFLSNLSDYDAILPEAQQVGSSLKDQLKNAHGDVALETLADLVENCFTSEEKNNFERYLCQGSGYFYELYILRKDLFFEFSEWLYHKLLFLCERCPDAVSMISPGAVEPLDKRVANGFKRLIGEQEYMHYCGQLFRKTYGHEKRDIAFLLERLTGFFLYDKIVCRKLRYAEIEFIDYASIQNCSPFRLAIIDAMRESVRKASRHD